MRKTIRETNKPTLNHQKRYIGFMKNNPNIPTSIKDVADFRVKVLNHKKLYGIHSAIDAFDVARSTIYLWQKRYRRTRCLKSSLAPTSTRPKRVRQSKIDYRLVDEIARLRQKYPRMGKSKLKPFLDQFCKDKQLGSTPLPTISESSIGRCLAHLKNSGRIIHYRRLTYLARDDRFRDYTHNRKAKLRRNGYYPKEAGGLLQIDCVVKFQRGVRRYIISAIDYVSSFAYSHAYEELNSANAADFMDKLRAVAPFDITHIQTDNGLEFHKHFDEKLVALNITHFWNYTKKPIYNGKIERYNRTIQEEFADAQIDLLFADIYAFNAELADWLIFYNTERPHHTHRDPTRRSIQIPPMKAFLYMLKLNEGESNMLWTHTIS